MVKSLIRISMDSISFSIDGYDVGLRIPPKAYRACSVVVWDKVRTVLDGFDINEPEAMREEIAALKSEIMDLEEEVRLLNISLINN